MIFYTPESAFEITRVWQFTLEIVFNPIEVVVIKKKPDMYALLQRCCIVQLIGPLTVIFSGGMLCVFHPVIFHMKTLTGHISNLIFVQLQFSGGISAFVDAANLSILNRTEIIGE